MTKPGDIPQSVWDAAYEASFRGDWSVVEAVARAILAAVEEEREASARVVETGAGWIGAYHKGGRSFTTLIAAAIRNRS